MPSWFSFLRAFIRLTRDYWWSERSWQVWGLTVALVILTGGQVAVPVAINFWNQNLFDALQGKEMSRFIGLIGVLGAIIVANAAINTVHLRLKRRLQIGWRDWLTRRLLGEWMTEGRPYLLGYVAGEHDNPDGRIAEDARITTETALDLGLSMLYCAMLLASFIKILWSLSGLPVFHIGGYSFTVPGHLVWIGFVYASVGIGVALLLGRPIVRATDLRQSKEADFRFGLVHARENAVAIALIHGETDERRRFAALFAAAVDAWNRQTSAFANITSYSNGWSVLSGAFPTLVASPRFIAGTITLGTLIQTAQAFQQMISAMSWPVDNLSGLAQWRASVTRVLVLRAALVEVAARSTPATGQGIERVITEGAELAFHQVAITDPAGRPQIAAFDLIIPGGEHVVIGGERGAGEMLFKAAAGIWSWGSGRIELPPERRMMFMPERPHLPIGTLRDAIGYPAPPGQYGDGELGAALARVGLPQLASRLGETATWDQELEGGAVRRLGFARLLLRHPDWIMIDEATDALDADSERDMVRLLIDEFPATTLLIIGEHPILDELNPRKLMLERRDGLARLMDAAALEPPALIPPSP